MYETPGFQSEDTYTPDNLIAGEATLRTEDVTVAGGDFPRGTVMGRITADGKFTESVDGAADGSEVPVAILAQDTDASGGDVVGAPVYRAGDFNERELTLGAGHTLAVVREAFFDTPINILPSVSK